MSEFSLESFLVLDALIAAGVIIASLAFTYTIGRYSIVPMITALGIGATFAALAPYVGRIPGISAWPVFQQNIVVFLVVTALAYWVFLRHAYFDPRVVPSKVESMACGLLIAGFILAVLASWLPAEVMSTISPQLRTFFGDALPRSLWLLAPIIVFGVMRKR